MFLDLLRRTWLVWCQTVWLWRIDIEINRYNRHKQRMARRRNAINQLTTGYDDTFGVTFGVKPERKEVTA